MENSSHNSPCLVLASSSKQRLSILHQIGFSPAQVIDTNANEEIQKSEPPKLAALRLAFLKNNIASKMLPTISQSIESPKISILSLDTIVSTGRKIIDKCLTKEDTLHAISHLSGKGHRVYTAVVLRTFDRNSNLIRETHKTSETRIKFKKLSQREVRHFVKTQEGIGKAGGYNISGLAESFICKIIGSHSGVRGLPAYETTLMLNGHGIYANQNNNRI